MAVDLATSGSLGYGIGLQGKVPDKSNLVLQLENQRLKRQALKGQEEEEKQKKEEKQLNLLAKGLNVDSTKWHRTLVPSINKFANESMQDFYKLYQTNPKLALNSIPQIMRSFEEKVSPLYTTNDQRKNFQKSITQKIINGERVPNDMLQFNQYLNMGDDASLDKPWESDLGIYKITPNSIVSETVIPKSTAEEDAKLSADAVGNVVYAPDAMGVMASRVYDDASVLGYMNQRYKDEQKKLSDIVYIEPNLRKVWRESGLEGQGVTFKKFTTDPSYAKDVENVLLEYNKSLLAKNAPAPRQVQLNERQELDNAASAIANEIFSTPGVDYITTTKQLPKGIVDKSWNAYIQTDIGKMVVAKAGGEKNARALFDTYLPQKEQQLRQLYKPSGVAGAKGEDWVIEDITAVRPKILNAQQIGSIRTKREELADREKRKAEGLDPLLLSEEEVVSGVKDFSGLEKETPAKQFRVDPKGMREAYFSVIPTTLNRVQGWSTGDTTPQYDIVNGTFRSVLLDKQGNPKFIIIDETAKPGERSNTWAVPFELNKSVLGGYSNLLEKKKPAQPAKPKTQATSQPKQSNKKTIQGF